MYLEGVKEGDKVVLFRYDFGFGDTCTLHTIEKVGKLHITVDGRKYRKCGMVVGGTGYLVPSISKYVPAHHDDKIALSRCRNQARALQDVATKMGRAEALEEARVFLLEAENVIIDLRVSLKEPPK